MFTKLICLFSYRQVLVRLRLGHHLVPPVLGSLEQLELLLLVAGEPGPGPGVPGVCVMVLVRLGMSVSSQPCPGPVSVPHSLYQT